MDSAIFQARQTFDGEPLYSTIQEVAASYWHSISTNHPFVDGNKRTAVIAAAFFLHKNGWALNMSDDEIIEVGLGIATAALQRSEVFERVTRRARQL